MAENFLNKLLGGIEAIAPTVANLVVPGSGPLLHDLMRSVTGDAADTPIEQVAAKINEDPKLFLELQRLAMDHEVKLHRIEAQKMATVNATMQAEAKSEKWPQYMWRPFNGFLYGLAVIAIYFLLPLAGKTVPDVPQFIWIGWGAILGVTTWDRGKEKRVKVGEQRTGMIVGMINAIKGK
ncbi:MAG: holin family protein [Desulfobulbaceae bacterium]|nr:holin family protein [Desulfobulbaceae bacterium]